METKRPPKPKRGFLDVDYDDGEGHTFRGLHLRVGEETKHFNTGDPVVDFYDYYKFMYSGQAEDEGIFRVSHSSSVDHWFMDTDEYEQRQMTLIGDKLVILSEHVYVEGDDILTVVIHKDMKTFEEVKEYVNSKRES